MKKRPKNRFLLVIFGIIIGIFIGGSIVWWNQNFKLSNWFVVQKTKQLFSDFFSSKSNESENNSISFEKYQNKKNNVRQSFTSPNDSIHNKDSLDYNQEYYDDYYLADRLHDSLSVSDSTQIHNNTSSNNDVVKKDELIASKTLVIGKQKNNNMLDSLFLINSSTKNNTSGLKLEFWKSPVNFKGYKMDNNKLIIFGINNIDFATFENEDKKLYMNYMGDYYLIEPSSSFKSLIPLTNKAHPSKKKKPKN
ncbi:MAG: hypothetical protein WCH34_02710 [Bacteroidota bacterium]